MKIVGKNTNILTLIDIFLIFEFNVSAEAGDNFFYF